MYTLLGICSSMMHWSKSVLLENKKKKRRLENNWHLSKGNGQASWFSSVSSIRLAESSCSSLGDFLKHFKGPL